MGPSARTGFLGFVLIFVGFGASIASPIQLHLSVTKTDYLVAEPVSITFSWTNRSEETIEFDAGTASEDVSVHVSVDGGKPSEFTRPGLIPYRHERVKLNPGESYVNTVFVVYGRCTDAREQLLLKCPGRYTLRTSPDDKSGAEIRVRLPRSEQEGLALAAWKEAAAQFELATRWKQSDGDRLKSLADDHPSSVYGEYARLGVAMHVLSAHLRPDAERPKDVALHVETLLRDSKNPSIIEHALWLKVFLSGREERNRIPYEIQQVNPKSEYLQRLRQMGIMPKEPGREDEAQQPRPSPEEKPTTRGPIPLVIDQGSLAGLPAGAANLLEKYWKAFARRDIDGAMECLSDEFVSIDGSRDRRRRYWESTLATVDVTHLHIRVDKASEATSYRSPPGPVGKSARLQGNLLVVQGQGTALEKGRTEASAITWVLRRVNEDTWTIASEFAGPVGQQHGEARESPEAIDPADQPRPPGQEPPEKPDGAEAAHKGWIVVHPARTKFDPTHFKTVPVEDHSFLHEKHRRDEILRELIEKYGADKDVEIREGGGQIFVVYRWVKDPWLEQMREEYARATLDQFKLIYASDEKVGPYLLKDVKTQYDVTVDHVPYALMLQFHDDQRLATAEGPDDSTRGHPE